MNRSLAFPLAAAITASVIAQSPINGIVRLEPALDTVIPASAKAELLKGDYFGAIEGPVWVDDSGGGYLLFSDMAANVIYKWTPAGQLSVYLEKSGYTANDVNNVGGQYSNGRLQLLLIGSNGLTIDREGRLITAYDVAADDTIANPRVLIDTGGDRTTPGNTDGMKVDRSGNIYCSGPGGIWIVSPQGKHLGTIVTPERVANLAFGDADSKTLYMVGGRSLWRIRVNIAGIRPVTKEKR